MNIDLALAPLDSTDMALVRTWRNDHRIWRFCRQHDVISDVEQFDWFQRQSKDPTIRMYKIVAKTQEKVGPVGVCGLTSINMLNRNAEFSLYVAPEVQGRGIGRAALKLLFAHGFLNLGLHQIWGESFEGNPAMRIFDEIGMKRDGVRRDFYFRDGRFVNANLFSITGEEWLQQSQRPSSSGSSSVGA